MCYIMEYYGINIYIVIHYITFQVEMCQDFNMIIPVMITVLVAKWTADNICKPLFKFQLDGKSLPVLDQEPIIALEGEM